MDNTLGYSVYLWVFKNIYVLNSRKERNIELNPCISRKTWLLYLSWEKIIYTINIGNLISSNNKDEVGINKSIPITNII